MFVLENSDVTCDYAQKKLFRHVDVVYSMMFLLS
jgi:hypothetical protein